MEAIIIAVVAIISLVSLGKAADLAIELIGRSIDRDEARL